MNIKIKITFYFLILFLAGCSLAKNYDKLMVLRRYGDNQQEIEDYLNKQDMLFSKLRQDISNNRLKKGESKQEILNIYGDPVYCKAVKGKPGIAELFLYRHPTKYFFSDKAYLYFDNNKLLDSWKFEQSASKSNKPH